MDTGKLTAKKNLWNPSTCEYIIAIKTKYNRSYIYQNLPNCAVNNY